MPMKSTRAFRTISEAAEELELQPHVLRFWESKFPQIQPMKRRGGRRFYRPEDVEFLRGIQILLHREKHPIKDVQKLIRIEGPESVIKLGRSAARASRPKDIRDTRLVPKRIKPIIKKPDPQAAPDLGVSDDEIIRRPGEPDLAEPVAASSVGTSGKTGDEDTKSAQEAPRSVERLSPQSRENLMDALARLRALKESWREFL